MFFGLEVKVEGDKVSVTPVFKAHKGATFADRKRTSSRQDVREATGEVLASLKASKDYEG